MQHRYLPPAAREPSATTFSATDIFYHATVCRSKTERQTDRQAERGRERESATRKPTSTPPTRAINTTILLRAILPMPAAHLLPKNDAEEVGPERVLGSSPRVQDHTKATRRGHRGHKPAVPRRQAKAKPPETKRGRGVDKEVEGSVASLHAETMPVTDFRDVRVLSQRVCFQARSVSSTHTGFQTSQVVLGTRSNQAPLRKDVDSTITGPKPKQDMWPTSQPLPPPTLSSRSHVHRRSISRTNIVRGEGGGGGDESFTYLSSPYTSLSRKNDPRSFAKLPSRPPSRVYFHHSLNGTHKRSFLSARHV